MKRISSVNKSGPFVGSEFAFEDLTSLVSRYLVVRKPYRAGGRALVFSAKEFW